MGEADSRVGSGGPVPKKPLTILVTSLHSCTQDHCRAIDYELIDVDQHKPTQCRERAQHLYEECDVLTSSTLKNTYFRLDSGVSLEYFHPKP